MTCAALPGMPWIHGVLKTLCKIEKHRYKQKERRTNPFHVQLDALEEVVFSHFQLGRPFFLIGIQQEGEVSLPHFDHLIA